MGHLKDILKTYLDALPVFERFWGRSCMSRLGPLRGLLCRFTGNRLRNSDFFQVVTRLFFLTPTYIGTGNLISLGQLFKYFGVVWLWSWGHFLLMLSQSLHHADVRWGRKIYDKNFKNFRNKVMLSTSREKKILTLFIHISLTRKIILTTIIRNTCIRCFASTYIESSIWGIKNT